MSSRGLVLMLVVAAPAGAHAQAWTRDAGRAYLSLSVTRMAGDRIYAPNFEKVDIASRYSQLTVGFYGELGVIDRWLMATVSSELYRVNELERQGRTQGLGDTRVGLWSGVITAPFRLSLGLVAALPTGDSEPDADTGASVAATLAARSLPTGNGQLNLEPHAVLGYSFGGGGTWPLGHYVVAGVGLAPPAGDFSAALTYRAELGTNVPVPVLDRFWLILRLTGQESLASEQEAAAASFSGLGNGVTFTALSAQLYGRIWEGLGASIAVDTAFRARGLLAAAPIKLAFSYEL